MTYESQWKVRKVDNPKRHQHHYEIERKPLGSGSGGSVWGLTARDLIVLYHHLDDEIQKMAWEQGRRQDEDPQ